MTGVRLVGYNIRALRDDEDAVVRVLRGLRPDIVCLQEVPRFPYQLRDRHRLARRCGLALVPGRRKAGLAIMLGERVRLEAAEYHLLPRVPRLHLRGLAVAAVEIEGVRLVAASTHLDLETEARKAHTAEIVSLLDRARRTYEAPVVLSGDINEEPDGPSWAMLSKAFQDGYAAAPEGEENTYSAADPHKRIDAIFADHKIGLTGCGVPADPAIAKDYPAATDHRPLLATFTL